MEWLKSNLEDGRRRWDSRSKVREFGCGETKVRTPSVRRISHKAYVGAKAHERPFVS
jgi:hypothetical protein